MTARFFPAAKSPFSLYETEAFATENARGV